jgi:hypothetical protein
LSNNNIKMAIHTCNNYNKSFFQKNHLADHLKQKHFCKKDIILEECVEKTQEVVLNHLKIESNKVDTLTSRNPALSIMDYSKMSIKDLTTLCKKKDIKGYSRKKKADIIAILISHADAPSTSEPVNEVLTNIELIVVESASSMHITTAEKVREAGLDKFYTIPTISEKCLASIESRYKWSDWELVIEPSAGNGSFLTRIPTNKKIGIDISPEHKDIIKQDFLAYFPPSNIGKILVVGNPPFGRISSLAIKFFNHASKWADVIAFIVPRTFRRVSVHNKLNANFHLIFDEEIPMEPCSFSPPMMAKCCFQIWEKQTTKRSIIELSTSHDDWEFLGFGPNDAKGQPTPPKGADFVMRAYGGKCGEIIDVGLEAMRPKSWHWIKSKINKNTLIERFNALDYTLSLDTARQNSMGRGELVRLYSEMYD